MQWHLDPCIDAAVGDRCPNIGYDLVRSDADARRLGADQGVYEVCERLAAVPSK